MSTERKPVERLAADAGFSLIEMAVTMSVFAIMVAIGVPAMRTWIDNNRVRTTANQLADGLRIAKAEALRSSRQTVFAFTNTTTPNAYPVAATANGSSWAVYTIPSMTDGTEAPNFVQGGTLSNANANVAINTNGVSAVCFNSVGRMVASATAALTAITGGATCAQPTAGTPPVQQFGISLAGADRNLQVNVSLGGQIHMCDPKFTLSAANPEGC